MNDSARQPRVRLDPAERRDSILAAAEPAFGEHPYLEVSMASIGRAAGVSEGLVFRYFPNKADLHAACVERVLNRLADAQQERLAELPVDAPARDRIRTTIEVELDQLAATPRDWATVSLSGINDPTPTQLVRQRVRSRHIAALDELLPGGPSRRRQAAIVGYLAFLDGACAAWVDQGCRADERCPLIEASLGALEGALGDWGG